jgi:hypothetical protein
LSSAYDYIENLKNDPKNKIIHFNNFLDYFYSSKEDGKKIAVAKEPNDYQEIGEVDYGFLVSSVHYLCNLSNITPPEWVFKEKYKLKEPYFSNNEQSKYKNYLLIYSPPEFKFRNMFVTPNVLSRV